MRVYPEVIINKSSDLTAAARELRMIGAEIDYVRNALSGQEGLGSCQDSLREMERMTEDLVAELIVMASALEDIGMMYLQCDQNAERDVAEGVNTPVLFRRVSSLSAVSMDPFF
ncbi:MAG: hypothetical protein J6D46_00795 [Lachnospiraceae bacterium]|nr:hypothetical protein [Lachnospiraceae bacterium]